MESICRLCAKVKHSIELKHSFDDICLTLNDCCQSIEFQTNADYPQNVCDSCFLRLSQSWQFFKIVETAQHEIQFLVSKKNENKSLEIILDEEIYGIENIKVEPIQIVDTSASFDPKEEITKNDLNGSSKDVFQDFEFEDHQDSQECETEHEEGAKEQKQSISDNSSNINMKNYKNFLELIQEADRLKDGTVNIEKIIELKLNDWSTLKYKCWKCDNIFEDCEALKAHINQQHPNTELRFVCSVCPNVKRSYPENLRSALHRHVTTKHFAYLSYW